VSIKKPIEATARMAIVVAAGPVKRTWSQSMAEPRALASLEGASVDTELIVGRTDHRNLLSAAVRQTRIVLSSAHAAAVDGVEHPCWRHPISVSFAHNPQQCVSVKW